MGAKEAASQLMPKLAPVERALHAMATSRILAITAAGDGFEHPPPSGQRLGAPLGGRAAREPFAPPLGRGGPRAPRGGQAPQRGPLLGPQRPRPRGAQDGIAWSVGGHPTDG